MRNVQSMNQEKKGNTGSIVLILDIIILIIIIIKVGTRPSW